MLEAKKKKAENIIEYILYLYHTEDVIRSCQMNIDVIDASIIKPSSLDKEEQKKLLTWYTDILSSMESEDIGDRGHLNEVIDIIGELSYIHSRLISDVENKTYREKYQAANSSIVEIAEKSIGGTLNPIELAINGMYGVMTLKMKKSEVYPETLEAVKTFTDFLRHLARVYHLIKKGEYELN